MSAMQNYQREVTAYTAGEGKLSVALKGYFPCHNTEEVVAQIGYDAQSDLENTADSVFCAHGAGFIVPWDQVFSYMHLPPVPGQDKSGEEWYPGQWLPDAANFHAKTGRKKPGSARKRLTESLTGHTMLIRKTKMPAQRTAIKRSAS